MTNRQLQDRVAELEARVRALAGPRAAGADSPPRFALGDRVVFQGQVCEVVTVSAHRELLPDGSREYLYGVRLPAWDRVEKTYLAADGEEITRVFFEHPETKERRDHAADSVGCLPEPALSPEDDS